MELFSFAGELFSNPALLITALLATGVILVNGGTDAPNAIATCVATRAMRPGSAILMAAVFNFLGVFAMTALNAKVAATISNIADFGTDTRAAVVALCAAMFAIVVWAVAAWIFGIPTSESHALIAGLTGAAVSLRGSFDAINGGEWLKVLLGLLLSTVLGFAAGYITAKLTEAVFRSSDRRHTAGFFNKAQICGGAAMAFMHGAQDGQKFLGVFMLGMALARGQSGVSSFDIPVWLMVYCSLMMAVGTAVGGKRIIKTMGLQMVKLEKYQGFAADAGAAACLLFSSVTGIPVSTTHMKATALMGVSASRRLRAVNWSVAREMVLTWVLTFPGCGAVGYIMVKLFLRMFSI